MNSAIKNDMWPLKKIIIKMKIKCITNVIKNVKKSFVTNNWL